MDENKKDNLDKENDKNQSTDDLEDMLKDKLKESGVSDEELQKILKETQDALKQLKDFENGGKSIIVPKKTFKRKLLMFIITLIVDMALILAISGYFKAMGSSWVKIMPKIYLYLMLLSLLFTLLSYICKYIFMVACPKLVFKSYGTIIYLGNILSFVSVIYLIPNIVSTSIYRTILFFLIFSIARIVVNMLLISKIYNEKIITITKVNK